MSRLQKSRWLRRFAAFIAALAMLFSFTGCSNEMIADTALAVLDAVLSDSDSSSPSEQFGPPENSNAPPESSQPTVREESAALPESAASEPPAFSSSSSVSSEASPSSVFSETLSSSEASPSSESISPESTSSQPEAEESPAIDEDGWYSDKDSVALYLHTYGKLPGNYITKKEASDLGWNSSKGNLWDVAEGMSIGGDSFGNREGLLPTAKGRKWYECDINYQGGYRGSERILFSSDGLIFYTDDHYQSYTQLY